MCTFTKKTLVELLCLILPFNLFSAATLSVNLTDSIRPVTHCATGALYGITETLPTDLTEQMAILKGHVYVQPARSGKGRQQAIGDAFAVAKRLKGTGAKVQIRLADILPGWPYNWEKQDNWINEVKSVITDKLNSGLDNFDGYEIWNEPYGTWNNDNGDFHTTVWKPTYDLIRQMDPNAKIIGPSFSFYSSSRMETFLTFCKKNNCLPDEICWHQWGSGGFVDALENLRTLERKLEIKEHPVCINEYSSTTHEYEGCPGYSVPFIAKFERYKVSSAMISWWFTGLPGRFGSLLTAGNEKGGGWWLYKWYGDMAGYMASVTPVNDKSEEVDGFAAVNKKQKNASIIIGGNTIGDVNVNINRLPDFFEGMVHVKIERVVWEDKDKAVNSTNLISETDMSISGSGLTIPVKVENKFYAYRIYLTPVNVPQTPYKNQVSTIPGTIEAENFDEAGQGFSYFDNDETNKGGSYREEGVDIETVNDGYAVGYTEKGEWLEYTVNVEETDDYVITANVSDAAETTGFQLYMDDVLITEDYTIPQTCEDWKTYEEINIATARLEKGQHVLKVLIVGSYVNIDWIKFGKANTTGLKDTSSRDSSDFQSMLFYDYAGHQVSADHLQRNKCYIASPVDSQEVFKFIKK